ncbi:MAG: Lon protease [Phycisphaerae bacterium]
MGDDAKIESPERPLMSARAEAPGDGVLAATGEASLVKSATRAAGGRQIPDDLPVLPARESVVFPGTIMPLSIGRPKSKALVEHAVRGNKLMGVVAQREKDLEDPAIEGIHKVGTVCMILKMLTLPDGTLNLIVHGITRFQIEAVVQGEPFLIARIRTREDAAGSSPEIEALVHNARQVAYRAFELSPNVPEEARVVLDNIETPGGVADFLAANVATGTDNRQQLLESFDVTDRLRRVNAILAQQVEVLELSHKIQSQVREQIDKTQREYFLQEQLKAIQRELGETDSRTAEMERLRTRLEKAQAPENVRSEAERELARMLRIPQSSPEYSVALDYVTWLSDLPWASTTTDQLNLNRAERILNEDHYDLEKVKRRIIEFLAVRKLKPDGRGPILCFVGPPGVGKTSLGQSIARALGRKFIRLSLGGVHDEAQLRGHRRTYIGAMPGRIIQELRKAGSANPVFMLDEVDKLGQDFRGDPASALLEILDPAQNSTFTDNYLDLPFDLSRVLFIGTANYLDAIPGPLRDRMEVIRLAGYTTKEKMFIARRYLIPRQLEEAGLRDEHLLIDDAALDTIISRYTREAGVRNLERQIGAIVRAVAARVARGRREPVKVTALGIRKFLGPTRFEYEKAQRTSVPGVAVGLAYTPTGGDILFVEATGMPGKGHLQLTGQIGDVMRESAQAAYSIIRSKAAQIGVSVKQLGDTDIHVHVPAGAIPKDGPSAGIAMLSAMVSLLTRRPCRPDVAMTGELTLTGRVLGIGGVKEKVLAAHRAGIQRVILPAENREDLVDIPAEVRRQLKFTFVRTVDRVLETVLLPAEEERAASSRAAPARHRKQG